MKQNSTRRKPPHGTTVGTLARMLHDAGFTATPYAKRTHYLHGCGARITFPHTWKAHDNASRAFIHEVATAIAQAERGWL